MVLQHCGRVGSRRALSFHSARAPANGARFHGGGSDVGCWPMIAGLGFDCTERETRRYTPRLKLPVVVRLIESGSEAKQVCCPICLDEGVY